MEKIRNLPANEETVETLRTMALATPADHLANTLRKYGHVLLASGYASEQLYVDLMRAYDEVAMLGGPEEREDALLDVMDFITGWCAPKARLY